MIGWSTARTTVVAIALSVGGFVAGIFTDDFVDFRSDNRQLLEEDISQFRQSASAVDAILIEFAKVAAGEETATPDKLDKLRLDLVTFQRSAQNLAFRVPGLTASYENLENSMLSVIDESTKVSSPLHNKKFVQTVASFVADAEDFEAHVIREQRRYFRGW